MNESQLKKSIVEEINKILQEDLGAGSNQNYAVSKDYRALEVLKQALGREMLGRDWSTSSCDHFARTSVKKAVAAINQAIIILQEK
jgi:hypothetical protein